MMATLSAIAITLGELVGPSAGALASAPIRDLVLDSRAVHEGAAFVALKGTRDHGLRHAADAVSRGAEVVLYDPDELGGETVSDAVADRAVAVPRLAARCGELAGKLYGPAMRHVELAGVTGTNGKTTVAWLVAQAMARAGRPCGYIGTLGYGLPDALEPHALTTPDCFTLHRELASVAASGGTHAALEVSSHALAQDRIAGLAIRTAAFTNLTRDHLDAHGSLDAYGAAKAQLFERAGLRYAVLNVRDGFGAKLAERLASTVTPIRVATAGVEDVDLGAHIRARGLEGLELEVFGHYGEARLCSPLIGTLNAENLLVALGVLVAWDLPLADACAALEHCAAPPGRLEVVTSQRSAAPYVVVDYAHTPDGLDRVLETVRSLATGDVWCVFGCGGERDRGKRAPMGAIAAARADHVIVTDDNPRGEDPDEIVREILAGIGADAHVVVEHDRAAAIRRAIRGARPGDVVLIAGKGHETTQRIGADERPFSDRAVALAALEELG